jgi:hypothetical protein
MDLLGELGGKRRLENGGIDRRVILKWILYINNKEDGALQSYNPR